VYEGLPIPVWAKFCFCLVFDLFDFTFGRLMLGVSIFSDVGSALLMCLLWGPMGLLNMWEVVDPTEQIDGFVPTNTLVAWLACAFQ